MSDMHKHKCKKCSTIWKHDGDAVCTLSQNDAIKAHLCPKCDNLETERYYGPEFACHEVCLAFPSTLKVSVLASSEAQATMLALLMSDHATHASYGSLRVVRCVLGGVVISESSSWELQT